MMASDMAIFHRVAANLFSVIEHAAGQDGKILSLRRADTVVLVMSPDNSAQLWIDTAAILMETGLKKGVQAGMAIFESDIADVTGMWFPCIEVGPKDRLICLFREGWRFGLFFDFNPDGNFSINEAKRDLGTMHRQLKYAELYAALATEETLARIVQAGWFPFIEIMNSEFKSLRNSCAEGLPLHLDEAAIVNPFSDERLEQMHARWLAKGHFKAKEPILRSAIDSYKAKNWVATLKIVLTEIEGILAEAYFNATGQRTGKLTTLLDYAVSVAVQHAGGKDTLFFPTEFARYLKEYVFANFDPASDAQSTSRHAVGHGRVRAEDYTQVRALQALLTLDQLAFYT
jgi:hypothetical protein